MNFLLSPYIPNTCVERDCIHLYIDEVILQRTGATDYYYTHDYRYSVTGLTNSAGTIVESYDYKVYGERTVTSSGLTDIGYTGQRHDSETGLMYFKNRYYSTSMGSFVTRDPLGYVDGGSMYLGYFGGMRVDPDGLKDTTFKLVKVTVGDVVVFKKKGDCTVYLIYTHGYDKGEENGKKYGAFNPVDPGYAVFGFLGCYVNTQNIGNGFPKIIGIFTRKEAEREKTDLIIKQAIAASKKRAKIFEDICCEYVKIVFTYTTNVNSQDGEKIGGQISLDDWERLQGELVHLGVIDYPLTGGGLINRKELLKRKTIEIKEGPIKNDKFNGNCRCE